MPVTVNAAFVIAIANERVSTPTAYKDLDLLYKDFTGEKKSEGEEKYPLLCESLSRGEINPDGLFNVFEDAVLVACEGARNIKAELIRLGAIGAMMSGSGPSVFGVFKNIDEAKKACFALREKKYKAYCKGSY